MNRSDFDLNRLGITVVLNNGYTKNFENKIELVEVAPFLFALNKLLDSNIA